MARPDSEAVAMIGAGVQARTQLEALKVALPRLQEARAFDIRRETAEQYAKEMSARLAMDVYAVDSAEAARYHGGQSVLRPYVFPLIGPAGRRLTRLGHPHDPHGHRHHRSVWIGHQNVNGIDFWDESSGTRILQERIESLSDGALSASLFVRLSWLLTYC